MPVLESYTGLARMAVAPSATPSRPEASQAQSTVGAAVQPQLEASCG